MRFTVLGLAIFYMMHSSHAAQAETSLLETIQLAQQENSDEVISRKEIQTANTLGDALKHLSGVQSSAFGPHAGAPVIRSLSGHRVGVMENGLSIQGLNAISGDIAIPFDSLFSQAVTVNKWSDAVRYGGQAIGGSVNIDDGLIPREIAEKSHDMEVVLRKGFNHFDAKGMRIQLNNQNNLAATLQFSQQEIDSYDIPGSSKAAVCETQVFGENGGVNSNLASQCQKDTRIEKVFNTRYLPYLNNYVLEHIQQDPSNFSDYYDSQESAKYTDKPVSSWYVNGKYVDYVNTPNPDYVAGESKEAIQKINQDVTPNYYKKLANTASEQDHYAIGATYFMPQGYIGFSADHKTHQYGVPGFSLENKSFQKSYLDSLPVSVQTQQNRFVLDALWKPEFALQQVQFKAAQINNRSGEFIGAKNANQYRFTTQQAEITAKHQPFKLNKSYQLTGEIGAILSNRSVSGQGNLKYLPDVKSHTTAFFIQEKLDFDRIYLDAGYRTEQVKHEVQAQNFKLSRNAVNTVLQDQNFDLNSFSLGTGMYVTNFLELKAKYTESERTPEINELYSSNPHY